jgi:2-desacetyl-2-hydroxyethyl bacteriochlorophyllide A dehydrogenase
MKAFLVHEPGRFGLIDVSEPSVGQDEVLVQVRACGICGSDLDILEGVRPKEVTAYPVIAGHEFSGEVVEFGPEVRGLKKGDKVAIDTLVRCNSCRNCRRGWTCHCLNGFHQLGCTRPGGLAEFVAVPQRLVYRLPSEMELTEAALAEPASCAAHGVSKAEIKPGDSVVILGGGPIGMLALQVARLFSPAKLVLVDLDDRKLEIGKKLGASHTINARKSDVAALIMDLTEELGADAIIECTGSLEPIQQNFSFIGTKGRLVVIGVPTKLQFEIDFLKLLMRDAVFRPSNGYTTEIWLWVLHLLSHGYFDSQTIITHRLPLSDILRGMKVLQERKELAIKVMTSA